MKKFIIVLLGIITIAFVSTSHLLAQTGEKGLAILSFKSNADLIKYVNENSDAAPNKEGVKSAEENLKSSKENLKVLKANVRATKSFKKDFKDADDAEWNKGPNAIVAAFTRNDVKTLVVYDSKGGWIHTLDYYPSDKTPIKVSSAIEKVYPNADIILTVDVKEGNMKFYIVQLEDKRTYKKVVVYDDEIELVEQLKKDN